MKISIPEVLHTFDGLSMGLINTVGLFAVSDLGFDPIYNTVSLCSE